LIDHSSRRNCFQFAQALNFEFFGVIFPGAQKIVIEIRGEKSFDQFLGWDGVSTKLSSLFSKSWRLSNSDMLLRKSTENQDT
jgi:hypothetical protein